MGGQDLMLQCTSNVAPPTSEEPVPSHPLAVIPLLLDASPCCCWTRGRRRMRREGREEKERRRSVVFALGFEGSKIFYMVKPCPNEMKCDAELSSYVIRDAEEYKNFCDHPKVQRPQPKEVIAQAGREEAWAKGHQSRVNRRGKGAPFF
ncbi:uncharacterized protein LOC133923284 [Phragmites australis]|uniref:uncharacterized protein LOC133923284 n=1 Tax=Phragmites australis TaxID=29695 RepID=UPI002D76CDF0|nr:uncharacterized protein LOC133923284 [Phragmites australis]